jgi:hypothetical protein
VHRQISAACNRLCARLVLKGLLTMSVLFSGFLYLLHYRNYV